VCWEVTLLVPPSGGSLEIGNLSDLFANTTTDLWFPLRGDP